jgi:hypothetical protein
MRRLIPFLSLCLAAGVVSASVDPAIDVGAQAKGAPRVVVGTVTDVQMASGQNDFGDELILSHVTLRVDETLKGPQTPTVVLTLEGGTVGDVTLEVSDMPSLEKGHRAALFMTPSRAASHIPYGRGAGVMRLDGDRVVDTNLTLADIRAAVKAAQGQ